MANSITFPVEYIHALDILYQESSLSSVLDNTQSKMEGRQFKIKRITTQGPANMDGSAYESGDVSVIWQTVTPDYDRGRKFTIDAVDSAEAKLSMMDALADYEMQHSVPEVDAYRFAKIASTSGIQSASGTIADAAALLTALNSAQGNLDGKSPTTGRILFVEASMYRSVEILDTTKSRETLKGFEKIIPVPQDRFYTAITLYDGKTAGQEAGGFIKNATTGKDINFLIVQRAAMEQAHRRNVTNIDEPDTDYDAYRGSQRKYGYCEVKENKKLQVFLHHKA